MVTGALRAGGRTADAVRTWTSAGRLHAINIADPTATIATGRPDRPNLVNQPCVGIVPGPTNPKRLVPQPVSP
jgi:hypothetical protein